MVNVAVPLLPGFVRSRCNCPAQNAVVSPYKLPQHGRDGDDGSSLFRAPVIVAVPVHR